MILLHIAHIDTALDWRGGQQSLLTLARGLRERGHQQTIVCPAASALADRASTEGFLVATRPRPGVDILHAHSGRAHNRAIQASLLRRSRRVVTRHVAFPPKHELIHRLKYSFTADAVIAVSAAVQRVLVEAGVPGSMIEVIHTGVELPTPRAAPQRDGPLRVGHLGAFTEEKGQDVLVDAARQLPDLRFVLAGEGPLRESLRQAAPTNVTFPGFVPEREEFYRSIDLFVMPSRSEAWGLAALEALAYGVPVIASDIEGLREFVPLRVPVAEPIALAEAIRAFQPSAALSERSRQIAARYSVERMAEQTEALYQRILNAPGQE